MKIKFFKQGDSVDKDGISDFALTTLEKTVNKFCNQHDVVDVSFCRDGCGVLNLITVMVAYRDE